ncbi:hypothetical protein EMCRGX_G007586 [Ephydatia muelleri]
MQSCTGALRELVVQCRSYSPVLIQRHYANALDNSDGSKENAEPSFTEGEQRHHVVEEEVGGEGTVFVLQKVKPKVDVQPPEAAKILRYLRRTVKLTDQDIHSYSYTTPSALGSSLADIQARVEKLQRVSFDRSSNKDRLGIVLARFPNVLEADLVNVHSVCELLEMYKFNRNWIRSLLKHHAHLFTHDPRKLQVNLEVMAQAGLTGRDIFQLINKMPLLLTHQMKQDLGQVLQHWKQHLKEAGDKQNPC